MFDGQQPPLLLDKNELLSILRANRAKHREVFTEAIEGYRDRLMAFYEGQIETLKSGRLPDTTLRLPLVQDHTRDYDRVIRMVSMHQGEHYPMDERSFAQFVEDDWDWRRQFLGTANTYAAATVKEVYGDE